METNRKAEQATSRKETDHGWGYDKDGKAITAEALHNEADRRGVKITDSVQLDLIAYEMNGNKARDENKRAEYHRSMEPTAAAVREAQRVYAESKDRTRGGAGAFQDRMKAVAARAAVTMKQQRERSHDDGRGL